ncbi:hypothetical protein [Nostoc sphaeroides]|uniref:hypothetical protein n=1 Tax=Nostoc sphaeroides TaxID=446679 RepID=UPI0011C1A2B6|nr:hypothetical protein [Nostoc sphaeroides]
MPFSQIRCRVRLCLMRSLNYKNSLPAKQYPKSAIALKHHFFRLDAEFVFVWCDRLIIKLISIKAISEKCDRS